jgi:Uma2 family endonuclease
MIAIAPSPTLEAFLELPETEPASEFINGEIIQKPMPQGEHSILQGELCEAINQVTKPQKIARAFPELRCVFGGYGIVPDVAVFRWERIPLTNTGRIENRFELHPDWAIEILSPGQSSNKVLSKLLHCSQHGTELGWLLDPLEESILIVLPEQRVQLLTGTAILPVLNGVNLSLTVADVFGWLSLDAGTRL